MNLGTYNLQSFRSNETISKAMEVLRRAVAHHAFPGGVLAVTHRQELVALQGFGRHTYDPDSPEVTGETIYDLASVTKVVAATAMAMLLYDRAKLALEQPLAEIVTEFRESGDTRRSRVTLRMLLAHSSGLPAYVPLYQTAQSREALLAAACEVPLEAAPMARAAYSDIGFILLGLALERIAGGPMDAFCEREIFRPLGMKRTGFCPLPDLRPLIPPTENDTSFRHRVIQGEVHDENATVLGGVAGHAGVFAPAADVAKFANCMLRGGAPIFQPETVALFTRRDDTLPGTSRALGWDTPSSPLPSQSGRYFSPRSFGHLGFTGTSLWIDPLRQISITLLTNRTWPDRGSQAIKSVRPDAHDAIIEGLGLTKI